MVGSMLPRLCRLIAALLILGGVFTGGMARAADPQAYSVTTMPTGDDALDDTLTQSSLLVSLQDRAPVPPIGLIERARGDIGRLTSALHSFGYYQGSMTISIAGYGLNDPALLPALDATPAGQPVTVTVSAEKGPLYTLRMIAIEGNVSPEARDALMLMSGQPAVASTIVAAQARVLAAMQNTGHAFAQVSDPIAYADDDAHVLDITFEATAGPIVQIGSIAFTGLSRVNEDFVRRATTVHIGDRYRPSAIEAARQALVATGVFTSVNVTAGDRPLPGDTIALTFSFQERQQRAVNLAGTYSTDLGISLSAGWSHRNLFGNAEQLNLSAAGTGLGGTATGSLGYKFLAQFIKPLFLRPDQIFQTDITALKQDLLAYNQQAVSAGVTVRRKFSPFWTGSIGINAMHENIQQKGTDRIYQLLAFPVTAAYDSTGTSDVIQDPLRGIRASFVVTPTESFGARTDTFFVLQALASTYFDFSTNGRSVLALRGQAGLVLGASNLDLPPDQRLYAGGSATVRGFRYQSIGPLFPDGDPIGGTSVDAATIEFRQRLFGDFGAAAFVDAGQASARGALFTGPLRVGAGIGARYYTAIGAVRADIAVPLTPVRNGDSFELYIGLGQAF
jgi:translocation and assembly module TamA